MLRPRLLCKGPYSFAFCAATSEAGSSSQRTRLGTPKNRASAIVEALESARYRAELQGRSEPLFADIEAALREEHAFLQKAAAVGREPTAHEACNGVADLLQPSRNGHEREFCITFPHRQAQV